MLGRGSSVLKRRGLPALLGSLALLLAGCGGSAEWKSVQIAPSYQPLRAVTFKVTGAAPGADMAGLEMAIVSAFTKWNIHATPLDEESAQTNLRVEIEKWAPGSKGTRQALAVAVGTAGVAAIALIGEIIVDVKVLGERGDVAVQGKVRARVHDTDDAIHEIADVIAFTVVKGEPGQQAPTSEPHTHYP